MRSAFVFAASVAITTFAMTSRPPAVHAQSSKTETRHVIVTTSTLRTRPAPGTRVSLFVDVTPKPAMHVYAPEQKDVIPVSLTLDAGAFTIHAPKFPRAEKYFFEPLNETQLVYSKPFRIVQDLTIVSSPVAAGRTGPGGSIAVTGTLRYQACDDAICYMPVNVPVSWKLPRSR